MMESQQTPAPIDLSALSRVHIIGVGGAGMSSIATVLAEMGYVVSGSDSKDSPTLERLRSKGVRAFVGHRSEQVRGAELVLRSSAVGASNPELLAAGELGLPVLNRTHFLPLLARRTPFVSISGTHGKTTTSSMTAVALTAMGADPSFIIGSQVHSLGASAGYRGGPIMVLEADESDGSFSAGPRAAALVTNVEQDHLDYWQNWERLVAGFREFLESTDGPRVVCVDDPTLRALVPKLDLIGYGFAEDADYRILRVDALGDGSVIAVATPEGEREMTLSVPGVHNALNATGALAVGHALGYDIEGLIVGLGTYSGVSRRFERRGDYGGIDFVDDYAHHPTELRAVISAATSGPWQRVVATFQPHRYSRTESLWDDFAGAFDGLDVLIVTDIYSAGEEPRVDITGERLASAIRASSKVGRVEFCQTLDDAASYLAGELRAGDLSLSIGAGDVTGLADLVHDRLRGASETIR